jgi:hypothetical protein
MSSISTLVPLEFVQKGLACKLPSIDSFCCNLGCRINDSAITILLEGFVIGLQASEVFRHTEHIKIAIRVGEASVSE